MKIEIQMTLLAVAVGCCLGLLGTTEAFAHCGKDHDKAVQVAQLNVNETSADQVVANLERLNSRYKLVTSKVPQCNISELSNDEVQNELDKLVSVQEQEDLLNSLMEVIDEIDNLISAKEQEDLLNLLMELEDKRKIKCGDNTALHKYFEDECE
jgi:Cdc6-like AAA superfamily ATPase